MIRNTKKIRILNSDDNCESYSTVQRTTNQQMQHQSLDSSFELYDKIQLSPTTGQSELISRTGSKISKVFSSSTQLDNNNNENHNNSESEESEAKCPTYAMVNKHKKIKSKECKCDRSQKCFKSADGLSPMDQDNTETVVEKPNNHEICRQQENVEEMYAVVHKKPKKCQGLDERVPTIPLHTIESLYTAVQKKPNKNN